MWRSGRLRRSAVFTLAALTVTGGGAGAQQSDAAVFRRIETLRGALPLLVVDGRGSDWGSFTELADARGDAGGDAGRDIVGMSLAFGERDLIVRVRTAGAPVVGDLAFWLSVDVVGHPTWDLEIGLAPSGRHFVRTFPEEGESVEVSSDAFEVAVGEVLEARIPLEALTELMPRLGSLDVVQARSWVRVRPLSWDAAERRVTDFGPAVAAFQLRPTPYPLDPPLPRPGAAPKAVAMPLAGQWWVSQGAFGATSHAAIWGYDLTKVDGTLSYMPPGGRCDNTTYYAWREPVRSPMRARVIRASGGRPDESPCEDTGGPPNEVYLDVGDDVGLWLAHFRQGAVHVATGETVEAGQTLGEIGNSGRSSGPHLHLGYYRISSGQETLPLALAGVRVGLNPGSDDPWSRVLDTWDVREGFFVESADAGEESGMRIEDPGAAGEDVAAFGGPVQWGVRPADETLADIRRRLAAHGIATVILDGDYPTAITDAAFVDELRALAARLDGRHEVVESLQTFQAVVRPAKAGGGGGA